MMRNYIVTVAYRVFVFLIYTMHPKFAAETVPESVSLTGQSFVLSSTHFCFINVLLESCSETILYDFTDRESDRLYCLHI